MREDMNIMRDRDQKSKDDVIDNKYQEKRGSKKRARILQSRKTALREVRTMW